MNNYSTLEINILILYIYDMIWDYYAKGKKCTEKNTFSKGNFTIKTVGTFRNTFGNVYFCADWNAYFRTNILYFLLSIVNIYEASVLVEDKNTKT